MNKAVFACYLCISVFVSCKAQTQEDEMKETSNKVIAALQKGNENAFEKLIGVDLLQIGKNKELIQADFKKSKSLFDRYNSNKQPEIILTEEYSDLGNRKVIIPFYKGSDTTSNISEARLELYFGPPNFVPLNKIANYKLVVGYKEAPNVILPPTKN